MGKAKSVAGVLLTVLFAAAALAQVLGYFKIDPKDLMMLPTGSLITIVSVSLFMLAAIFTATYSLYLSTVRLRRVEAQNAALKTELSKHEAVRSELQIINATWGATHPRPKVGDIINGKPRNAVMFHVSNDYFGVDDPAKGNDKKYVNIEYSFGGQKAELSRSQGEWVVIPEDPKLLAEKTTLTQNLEEAAKHRDEWKGHAELMAGEVKKYQNKSRVDDLKDIDESLVNRIRQKFMPLTWQYRLALHVLLRNANKSLSPRDWCTQLENHGYTDTQAKFIIRLLVDGSIILDMNYRGDVDTALQSAGAEIFFRPDVARIIGRLFQENPLC